MSEFYIHFKSKTMNPCTLQKDAYKVAQKTWLCGGCCSPRPGAYAIDVQIQERKPEGPLNFLGGCSLSMAEVSFLMRFGCERVDRDLFLGRVFGPDGEEIVEWVTFRARYGLIIRGTKHAGYRRCERCGRGLYFAMGKQYLCSQPRKDVELFEGGISSLIVPGWLAVECDMINAVGVTVDRLEVVEHPLDGLPHIVS